jgi:hypothetical protein
MSTWFNQQVSILGKTEDLSKILNLCVHPGLTTWGLGTIHLSAGQKNAPPFPLTSMSKQHPNVIFAVSTMVECDNYYRFFLLNGKHTDVLTMSPIGSLEKLKEIEGHYKWANKLKYDDVIKTIGVAPPDATRIPINEDTEIVFIEERIEHA